MYMYYVHIFICTQTYNRCMSPVTCIYAFMSFTGSQKRKSGAQDASRRYEGVYQKPKEEFVAKTSEYSNSKYSSFYCQSVRVARLIHRYPF